MVATTTGIEELISDALKRRAQGASNAQAATEILDRAWGGLLETEKKELAYRGFYQMLTEASNGRGGGNYRPNLLPSVWMDYLEDFRVSFGDRSVSILDMGVEEREVEIRRIKARIEGEKRRLNIFEEVDNLCDAHSVGTPRELPAQKLMAVAQMIKSWRER